MSRRYPLLIVLTMLMVLALIFSGYMMFRPAGLPFTCKIAGTRAIIIQPKSDIALPAGLQAGDRLDLAVQPQQVRVMLGIISINNYATLPVGHTYDLVVNRNGDRISLPVTTVDWFTSNAVRWVMGLGFAFVIWLFGIALLILWRGRDRTAAGVVIWTIAIIFGHAFDTTPFDGMTGLSLTWMAWACYLMARIGFYIMIESVIDATLTPQSKLIWRGGFILSLLAMALLSFGGSAMLVYMGWAGLLLPAFGIILTASYILPIAMLFVSYRQAQTAQKLKLRWMLWGSVVFVIGIYISNDNIFGFLPSRILQNAFIMCAALIYAYTILRHRVVDISVLIDRTLVYGVVTALVVGILAAVNSLVQHTALGTNTSLFVQIIVPLALGIVLVQVRNYVDKFVEQMFFRKKYLAAKALRRFARHCYQFEASAELLRGTTEEIHDHLNASTVAIYERDTQGFRCTQRAGLAYPDQVKADDPAFVAARTDNKGIDLMDLHSVLGSDGYVVPMTGPGGAQAVLVCANRPGGRFASDERKLLAYMARQVGTALDALHMRKTLKRLEAKASLVDAVLTGVLTTPAEIKARARELASIPVNG